MARVRRDLIGMLVAMACGLLGACGHSSADGAARLVKRHTGTPGGGDTAGTRADSGPTDLVAAVSAAGGDDGPVGLKFQVGQRPVAGRPVVMTLRLVVNQPLEHLEARFHPDDGLDISQGGDFDPLGHMDAGSALDHTLVLVPAHDGVFTVMATVTTGAAAEAVSRSFVIPIVVAASLPPADAVAAKPR